MLRMTIHAGLSGILYAWLGLLYLDLKAALRGVPTRYRRTTMHDRVARRAEADERAQRGRIGNVFQHLAGRLPWLPAFDAKYLPRLTRLPPGFASVGEKCFKLGTKNERWPPIIDDWQAILDPVTDSVAVDAEGAGSFIDRVGAKRFDPPPIRAPVASLHYRALAAISAR